MKRLTLLPLLILCCGDPAPERTWCYDVHWEGGDITSMEILAPTTNMRVHNDYDPEDGGSTHTISGEDTGQWPDDYFFNLWSCHGCKRVLPKMCGHQINRGP